LNKHMCHNFASWCTCCLQINICCFHMESEVCRIRPQSQYNIIPSMDNRYNLNM
jgi:hypothetical protein